MPKTLNDFIKDNQKFLKLSDGDSVTGTFLGQRVIVSKFDSSKETVEYAIKIEGRNMIWTCGNIGVAQIMLQLQRGDEVTIKRSGEGTKTVYKVTSPQIKTVADGVEARDPEAPSNDNDPFGDDVPF